MTSRIAAPSARNSTINVTFLLWHGNIGGAERLTVELAFQLAERGVRPHVVFVGDAGDLEPHLARRGIDHTALHLRRGSHVLRHPQALRSALTNAKTDLAICASVGYLGAVLRASGFRAPIAGVEHGAILQLQNQPLSRRLIRRADRLSGVVTYDAEIAVSEYLFQFMRRRRHAPLVRITNGLVVPTTVPPLPLASPMTVGYAGRLHHGKGVDVLLRAAADLKTRRPDLPIRLRIAGDGPMRETWQALTHHLDLADVTDFVGWTDDLRSHWSRCDLAVCPNDAFVESFCMSGLEAMGFGRALVVSDLGALPELVANGSTGLVFPHGQQLALSAAIERYASAPVTLQAHGSAAHERAHVKYDIRNAADSYLDLFHRLLATAPRSRKPHVKRDAGAFR